MNSAPKDNNLDIGHLIIEVAHAVKQKINHVFIGHKITYPQSRILLLLFAYQDSDQVVNQRTLEHEMGIKASSVSSLVRNLEAKEFIECHRDPKDSRNKTIVLSERGKELREILDQITRESEQAITRGMSEEEQQAIRATLLKIRENVTETGASEEF